MTEAKRALEVFVCTVLPGAPRLTTLACASKYGSAQTAKRTPGTQEALEAKRCRDCPIGLSHVRGDRPATWPSGQPIERRQLAPHGRPAPTEPTEPTAPAPRAPEEPMKTITYSGRTLSVSQWAEELGISSAAIGQRIKRGWTDVEAISTPGGGAVPARLERERAKATPAKSAPIKSVVTKRAPTPAKAAKPAATVSPPRDRAEVSGPVELLARLGYTVEDLGDHPRGRLFVIAKAS